MNYLEKDSMNLILSDTLLNVDYKLLAELAELLAVRTNSSPILKGLSILNHETKTEATTSCLCGTVEITL